MYGLQGKMLAKAGQRDALLAILLDASRGEPMPGCRLYIVSEVPAEPDAIAITEVWDDRASHQASLQLESVRGLIAMARPMVASMDEPVELRPVGGQGLD